MAAKYVVIIQCDIAHRRCSGFACTNAFYNKEEGYKNVVEGSYISGNAKRKREEGVYSSLINEQQSNV